MTNSGIQIKQDEYKEHTMNLSEKHDLECMAYKIETKMINIQKVKKV
jgi:hypothetical protein